LGYSHSVSPPPEVRYTHAYKAFWWNCVAVKAKSLKARCPFTASGWPSESAGATHGAMDAMSAIHALVQKYGAARAEQYLRKLASPPSKIRARLGGYFFGKPAPAPAPDTQ